MSNYAWCSGTPISMPTYFPYAYCLSKAPMLVYVIWKHNFCIIIHDLMQGAAQNRLLYGSVPDPFSQK